MNLTLRYYGDPILRKQSESIEKITDEHRTLATSMVNYIDGNNGIGLSAVQIGLPIRLFVCRSYIENPDGSWGVTVPRVFINPKIIFISEETIVDNEACMSIPKVREDVQRPYRIKVEAIDLDGKTFIEESVGYNARIRMHENDHLNGVLFIDRLPPKIRKKIEPQLREIKKKYSIN
ncbi:MAG TPA: peptide deformylase [Rhabdochlamydiaceae bacterium]|nr:peptide deformylase [Rhabdochlamydiaceae bacterium]